MSDRAKEFLDVIWECRNNGADNEQKLIAAVLVEASERVRSYNAQNNLTVLDKEDMLQLAGELYELN